MEVSLKVGIILSDEHLIVDVAEVIEGLIAAQTVRLLLRVDLLADPTLPGRYGLFLVSNTTVAIITRGLSLLFAVLSHHCTYFSIQILNIIQRD